MNILAIDAATLCGFAALINGSIRSGTQNMKLKTNESVGMKYLRFDAWLDDMNEIGLFDLIVYEKPHGVPGNAIESLSGFITGIHRYTAKYSHIEYMAVSPNTVKAFARRGNFTLTEQNLVTMYIQDTLSPSAAKSAKGKIPTLAYFLHENGRMAMDSNESDAYSILRFVMSELGITK